MTKIITSENRIIFDGHAKTNEECETISLMCEELTKSDKFKTVKYESGYAEFEKVGKTEELKFIAADGDLKIYDVSGQNVYVQHVWGGDYPMTVSLQGTKIIFTNADNSNVFYPYDDATVNTANISISYEGTSWRDATKFEITLPYAPKKIRYFGGNFGDFAADAGSGYSDVIINNGETITLTSSNFTSGGGGAIQYYEESTSKVNVDLTTLPGWSSLSSGSHSITIVAKADGYRDSEPSAAVSVEKAAAMPVKGDLISIDGKQYRVLKTNDNVAEVLAMYYASTSQSFHNSRNSNAYADSSLDFYLTQSFYKSLSTTMQNAIVAKTFRQDSWYYGSNSSAIAKYNGTYQTTNNYTLSLMSTTFGASISRKCYVLSCQDVIDYLEVMTSMGSADTTLTSENVWRMFWNQTTSPGRAYPWLRSASSNDSRYAFYVNGNNGSLRSDIVDSNFSVRPAFQIDLSKVEWTKQ